MTKHPIEKMIDNWEYFGRNYLHTNKYDKEYNVINSTQQKFYAHAKFTKRQVIPPFCFPSPPFPKLIGKREWELTQHEFALRQTRIIRFSRLTSK